MMAMWGNAIRRRLAGDEGLSLVEMLVAMFILSVAIMALLSTITASLAAMTSDERMVRGTQLSNESLENLRSDQWRYVGYDTATPSFAHAQYGYTPAYSANCPIVLPADALADGVSGVEPVRDVVRDGIAYTVFTELVWRDETADCATNHDRQRQMMLRTVTMWQAKGETRQLVAEAIRVPNVDEVHPEPAVPPGFAILDFVVSPLEQTLTWSGLNTEAIHFSVQTTRSASQVVVVDSSASVLSLSPTDNFVRTNWTGVIPAGSRTFETGETVFIIRAVGTDGGDDEVDQGVVFAPGTAPPPVMIMMPAQVGPSICVQQGSNKTHRATDITFEVRGIDPGDQVTVSWTQLNGQIVLTTPIETLRDANGNVTGLRYRATIPINTEFTERATNLIVAARRTTSDAVGAAESQDPAPLIHRTANITGCPA